MPEYCNIIGILEIWNVAADERLLLLMVDMNIDKRKQQEYEIGSMVYIEN